MKIYPIKFNPILKEKIWGGSKLGALLGKATNKNNIGESWEVSDVNGNVSEVVNGSYEGLSLNGLIEKFEADFLGAENFKNFGNNFPLLIKFLDAKTDLSVQVHPDDIMAKKLHNSFGKTEMWYIMDSDDEANIVLGLKDNVTDTDVLQRVTAKNVESVFNRELVHKGDSYFIPAGKIHAIGAGVLAAEIQQTSDITYRLYDWDRVDDNGKKRKLHTELAQKATKRFTSNQKAQYTLNPNNSANLAKCEYFTTNILDINQHQARDYSKLDSFVIFMCVEGEVDVTAGCYTENLKVGETILLPAKTKEIAFNSSNSRLLEVYLD